MKRVFLLLIVSLLTIGSIAQTKLELAVQALDNNDYSTVIKCTTDQLKDIPKDVNALAIRARAFVAQNDYAEALADINAGIKYWNKKCSISLGVLYCMRGFIYENMAQETSALNDYNTAIKKDKKNVVCYASRAKFYYRRKMYADAVDDFRKARDIDTNNVEYAIEEARCLLQLKNIKDAAIILDKVNKYEPMNAEAKRLRAGIFFYTEDYKSFVDMYIAYLTLEHGDLDMLLSAATKQYSYVLKSITEKIKTENDEGRYYWLGIRARVYQVKEQYQEALTDLNSMESLSKDTVSSFVLFHSAECYYALYEYTKATELYTRLIEISSDDEDAGKFRYRRAQCYADLGKHQQALNDFSWIIENDIDLAPSAYYGRGLTKEVIKDFDGALEDYNKGIILDENDKDLRMVRGRLSLLQKHDTIRANLDFDYILAHDTVPQGSVRHFALLYTGKTNEAISWMNKVLEEDPSVWNYYDAACLYARMDIKREAVKYLKEALELGYRNFVHIEEDSDLDPIRDTQEFKDLFDKYNKKKIKSIFNRLQ
jgi:tetratricopeptide (TPR) repeat protein